MSILVDHLGDEQNLMVRYQHVGPPILSFMRSSFRPWSRIYRFETPLETPMGCAGNMFHLHRRWASLWPWVKFLNPSRRLRGFICFCESARLREAIQRAQLRLMGYAWNCGSLGWDHGLINTSKGMQKLLWARLGWFAIDQSASKKEVMEDAWLMWCAATENATCPSATEKMVLGCLRQSDIRGGSQLQWNFSLEPLGRRKMISPWIPIFGGLNFL